MKKKFYFYTHENIMDGEWHDSLVRIDTRNESESCGVEAFTGESEAEAINWYKNLYDQNEKNVNEYNENRKGKGIFKEGKKENQLPKKVSVLCQYII